jgi:hypothetical protein
VDDILRGTCYWDDTGSFIGKRPPGARPTKVGEHLMSNEELRHRLFEAEVIARDGGPISAVILREWAARGIVTRPTRKWLGQGRGSMSDWPLVAYYEAIAGYRARALRLFPGGRSLRWREMASGRAEGRRLLRDLDVDHFRTLIDPVWRIDVLGWVLHRLAAELIGSGPLTGVRLVCRLDRDHSRMHFEVAQVDEPGAWITLRNPR